MNSFFKLLNPILSAFKNNGSGIMSFPRVEEYDWKTLYHQYLLRDQIRKEYQQESPDSMSKSQREAFLDFRSNPYGELIVEPKDIRILNSNRKEQIKPLDAEHKNVLMIFIDTVSRQNFFRKYKKTTEFLRYYNSRLQKNLRAYEYFRLHSIRSYTFPNIFASTYGISYQDSFKDLRRKRIDSYAKEVGYVTGYSGDFCGYSESEIRDSNNNPIPSYLTIA